MFSISARSTSDVRKIEHICRKNKSTMWSNLVWSRIEFLHTLQIHSMFSIHRVLGSRGFQWCGFHSCAFSKNSTNIQLMQFSLHQWRKSFTHAFWVTNDLMSEFGSCWFQWCGFHSCAFSISSPNIQLMRFLLKEFLHSCVFGY